MTKQSVQSLLEDIHLLSPSNGEIVDAVRALVKRCVKACSEEVKYGGIVFASDLAFCGVFAYKAHVTVEFSHGASLRDPFGHLEGAGKGRRHLKLKSMDDIQTKQLAQYVPLALAAAKASA